MDDFVIRRRRSWRSGGGRWPFPVRRVFCVGRNYAAHVREMGGDPDREAPFFFTKPADALVAGGADMPYPPLTTGFAPRDGAGRGDRRRRRDIAPEPRRWRMCWAMRPAWT